MADPAQCRKQAQKCAQLAQRARSAKARHALLKISQTWSKLAAQTEAYEAILCKWDDRASGDKKSWQGGQ
jgi:hypothetical protein